jgi:tetratricopeptide (TPR) repeat protein
MKIRDLFVISRGTRVVFFITLAVSLLAVFAAVVYYSRLNRAEDPRVLEARRLLHESGELSADNQVSAVFARLDSAAAIYRSLPDYRDSFEPGIIQNNKSSMLLLSAIYDTTVTGDGKEMLLKLAMRYCDSSIFIYERWISDWGNLTEEQLKEGIEPFMKRDDPAFAGLDYDRVLGRRVKALAAAQTETKRRLSVSLTNKAAIYRHLGNADSSLLCLNRALELWSANRTAKSNLSVLLGGEPLKPSIVESLFPPERLKKE